MRFAIMKSETQQINITTKRILIGRSPKTDLRLNHNSISKEHASIEFKEKSNEAFLKDLNSLNGTYLNDKRLIPGSENKICSNDVIVFGKEGSQFKFFYEMIDSPINLTKEREAKRSITGCMENLENNIVSNIGSNNKIKNVVIQEPSNIQKNIKSLNEMEFERIKQCNLDLEEKLMKIEHNMEIIKKENILLTEEIKKYKAKEKAIEIYASDLQRNLDEAKQKEEEKRKEISKLENCEFHATIQSLNQEIRTLQEILSLKDQQIQELNNQNSKILKNSSKNSANLSQEFLEHQMKEISFLKQQLNLYENNNLECNRKWQSLIEENTKKEEMIKSLNFQLERQSNNFKNLNREYDNKISQFNRRLLSIQETTSNEKQFEASKFLVEQTEIIQLEKSDLLNENEELRLENSELKINLEEIQMKLDKYNVYFDIDSEDNKKIKNLKVRIEELEDFIYEIRGKEGVLKMVECQQIIENLEKKLIEKNEEVKLIKEKQINYKKNEKMYFNEQHLIDFFAGLLEEKEKKITFLEKQIQVLSTMEKKKKIDIQLDDEEFDLQKQELERNESQKEALKKISQNFQNRALKREIESQVYPIIDNEISLVNEKLVYVQDDF